MKHFITDRQNVLIAFAIVICSICCIEIIPKFYQLLTGAVSIYTVQADQLVLAFSH